MIPNDQSILLSSFSKEELLDYDQAQDDIRTLLKSLLEKRDLGRLISPYLLYVPISWLNFLDNLKGLQEYSLKLKSSSERGQGGLT